MQPHADTDSHRDDDRHIDACDGETPGETPTPTVTPTLPPGLTPSPTFTPTVTPTPTATRSTVLLPLIRLNEVLRALAQWTGMEMVRDECA